MAEDDKKNLKAAQDMNAAMAKQLKLLEAHTREMNSHYEIMVKMQEMLKSAASSMGDPLDQAKQTKEVMKDVIEQEEKGASDSKKYSDAAEEALKKQETGSNNFLKSLQKVGKQFPVMKTAALAASHGILEGFRGAMAITGSLLKTTMSLVAGLGRVGVAILSIPFKIFQGLIDKAEAGGGGNELAAAYEAVRKQFGDFRQDAAHNVIATARHIETQFKETGLSTWRVFGTLAERLQLVTKIATAMGATWDVLGAQIAANAGHILAYQKGLGISEEGMKDFGQAAISLGKPLQELMRETASLSLSMQKQFGGSAKLYSRDMGKMINDVKHFGGVSQKVMVETAVYTRKLGIETEKLLGMIDKFDTFEDAAQSASKLAQTYGANIDAFKLMTAESPVEQLDMIRKAMFEAGKSAETMDRKDFKYISTITGMDEATVRASLSMKNQGVSLDKLREGSAKAEKQQLSQAEAMKQLAGAIERLTPAGQTHFGGFIKALIKGFNDGIEWTQEFRRTMINIRQDLRLMYFAGRQIGRDFVDAFPGVKQMMEGVRDLFDPAKFRKLTSGLVAVFKQFFQDLTTNPKAAFSSLMKALKSQFFDFFNMETSTGSKILEGFKKFMSALSHIAAGALKFLMESLTDGFKLIAGIFSGKGMKEMAAGATGMKKGLIEFFAPIWESFKESWPAMKAAFVNMITVAWDKIKSSGIIEKAFGWIKTYILGVAGVALGAGLSKGLGALILGSVTKGLASGLGGSMASGLANKLKSSGVIDKVKAAGTQGVTGATDATKQVVAAGNDVQKQAGNANSGGMAKVGQFLLAFAGVMIIGTAAVLLAAIAIKKLGLSITDIAKSLMIVTTVALASLPVAGALVLLSMISPGQVTSGVKGLVAVGAGIAIMALTVAGLTALLGGMDMSKMGVLSSVMFEMSKVFLVMAPVLLASALVGMIVGSQIGGAAMAIGFAAITAAVGVMAVTVTGIMKMLNDMQVNAGFKEKADAFVGVMNGVTGFATAVATIMEALRPSLISVLYGKDDMVERVNAARDFVSELVGNGGKGIIGIVTKVQDAISELARGGESMIKGAEIFGNVIGGMGQLMSAMVPPPEFIEESGGFLNFIRGESMENTLPALNSYIAGISDQIRILMSSVVDKLVKLQAAGIDDKAAKGVAVMASVFGAVADLMKGLTPSREFLEGASTTISDSGTFSTTSMKAVNPVVIDKLRDYIGKTVETMGNVLPGSFEKILAVAVSAVSSIDPANIEKLKVAGPILTGLLGALMKSTESVNKAMEFATSSSAFSEGSFDPKKMRQYFGFIGTFFEAIGRGMEKIIEKMPDVMEQLKKVKITPADLQTLKSVFEMVGAIPTLISSMKITKTDNGDLSDATTSMVALDEQMGVVANWMSVMFKAPSGSLFRLINVINTEATMIPDISSKAIGKLDSITKALTASTNMSKVLTPLKSSLEVNLKVVGDMIDQVNKLSDMLASESLMKIDIAPKLENLAKTVGLGGKGTYSINHKPVTITINLDLSMDAKQLDHVLVDRHGTSILIDKGKRIHDI